MLIIGHRGAMGHAPENTLDAIERALEMGVDWIEIDVYSVEEELLVIHDDTLDRTTNGSGEVMDHSVKELRQLDAGNGQKIPFLSEVMNLVNGRAGLNIELKGPNTARPVIRYLAENLPSSWPKEQILLSSFDHKQLLDAKALDPSYPRAALYWKPEIDFDFVVNELEAIGINPHLRTVTQEMVTEAHERGLKVQVYTVNEREDIERMRALGVDGVFTNFPDRGR